MDNLQGSIDGQPISIRPDGLVKFGSDQNLNVLIYDKVVLDPQKSQQLGRRWSKSEVYIRIQVPGERDYVDRPVRDEDKIRFPRHWSLYQRGHEQIPDGSPVDLLFPQSPEIPANLHGMGIHTVEQLAGLTEHGVQTIGMGASQWRNMAVQFLDTAKGGRAFHQLKKQLDDEKNKNEVLANQVAMLKTQLDRLAAKVDQKIPPNMVPKAVAPIAQQAAEFYEEPQTDFDDETTEAWNAQPASDEPLFHEVTDESLYETNAQSTGIEQPQRKPRGWPKGKPRGPRQPHD